MKSSFAILLTVLAVNSLGCKTEDQKSEPKGPEAAVEVAPASISATDSAQLVEKSEAAATEQSHAISNYTIACSSSNYRYAECPAYSKIRFLAVQTRLSSASCVWNSSFGFIKGTYRDTIWVSRGCRAIFNVTPYVQPITRDIACYSSSYRYARCDIPGNIVSYPAPILVRQVSFARCTLGSSWGYSTLSSLDHLWVDKGCRGVFRVTYYPR